MVDVENEINECPECGGAVSQDRLLCGTKDNPYIFFTCRCGWTDMAIVEKVGGKYICTGRFLRVENTQLRDALKESGKTNAVLIDALKSSKFLLDTYAEYYLSEDGVRWCHACDRKFGEGHQKKCAVGNSLNKIKAALKAGTGTWRDAIGCAPGILGGLSPEEAIRKVRDGQALEIEEEKKDV